MTTKYLTAIATSVALTASSQAAVILGEWSFTGRTLAASTEGSGITATDTDRCWHPARFGGNGFTTFDSNGSLFRDQTDYDTAQTGAGNELTGSASTSLSRDYYYGSRSIKSGANSFSIDSIQVGGGRTSSGMSGFAVYSRVNSFATSILTQGNFPGTNTIYAPLADLSSDTSYDDLDTLTCVLCFRGNRIQTSVEAIVC